MLARRSGSVLATSISLVAIILMMIIGTITYFENTSRRVNSERWRDVAEQAARSGLDMVLGWGEASIDRETRLPSDWEMADGEVVDPIRGFREAPGSDVPIAGNPRTANPGEMLAGSDVGEYVLARNGNILVTFKARLQQYRISEEMPRQYRLAIVGRVRKASNTPTDLNSNEAPPGNILAQRMILAHVGKEPFSKYAALIDIDAVKNWVPGEVTNGPVHINRGYVDETPWDDDNINLQANQAYRDRRSQMIIHDTNSPVGFSSVPGSGADNNPVFMERVSMTAYNDGTAAGNTANDDVILDPNSSANHFRSFLLYNGNGYNTIGAARAQDIFRHPDNQGALPNGQNGPVLEESPVAMPRSSRSRLTTLLGVSGGRLINDFAWFNRLQDGLYVFTQKTWSDTAAAGNPQTFLPPTSVFNYSTTDPLSYPSGGIYIRGNVEIMRTAVSGAFSYYLFQLGYGDGADGGTSGARRVYIVRVNRESTSKQVDILASPNGVTLDAVRNSYATLPALNTLIGNATSTTTPADFAIRGANNGGVGGAVGTATAWRRATLRSTPSEIPFPFNGVIFVDLSAHDPARNLANPTTTSGVQPLTGNIYALGDPGRIGNPSDKVGGNRGDRIATYVGTDPAGQASKLTILSAGNVVIQNHLLLEAICANPGTAQGGVAGFNPTQDNFTLNDSRDLLGIVADKQVVIGACAPSATRGTPGLVVHAAIAALGDPSYNGASVPWSEMTGTTAYRGSFTTEGLMQLFPGGFAESYNVLHPGLFGVGQLGYTSGNPVVFNSTAYTTPPAVATNRYPALPLTDRWWGPNPAITTNPNISERGDLIIFGSISQKRRGALGVSNRSYDKDFRYDKRLMSIAPPLFPTSTNVRLKTSRAFSPEAANMVYRPNNLSTPDFSLPEHLISIKSD